MSTVVYRAGIIVADTAVHEGNILVGRVAKIVRGPQGQVAGGAGDAVWCRAFLEWVYGGEEGEFPPCPEGAGGFIVDADAPGVYRSYGSGSATAARIDAPWCAMGSGSQVAVGALEAGAAALTVAECATARDAYSCLPIVALKLGGEAAWPDLEGRPWPGVVTPARPVVGESGPELIVPKGKHAR